MVILGIDPGYATVGWGVIRFERGRFLPLDFGAVLTDAETPFSKRLLEIHTQLSTILVRHRPDAVSVEELFFNTNVTTAITVAHGRGVALLAAKKSGRPVYEYTPLQVKQAVTGYGRAEKAQVMEMVRMFLGLQKVPRPDDAADALAVAICHAHSARSALFENITAR